MSNSSSKGFTPTKDYPFIDDVVDAISRQSDKVRTTEGYTTEEHIIIRRKIRIPGFQDVHTKIFKNKDVLQRMSPEACKLMIHIALRLEWESPLIHLTLANSEMSRRKYEAGMIELMERRIITKKKNSRGLYWVNVTVVFMGQVNDPEHLLTQTIKV